MEEVFDIIQEGIPIKVKVYSDIETSLYLALAIFLGMVLALAIYAKFLK